MAETDSLEALEGLYQDLRNLSESFIPQLDRLSALLDSRVEEFKRLLDKPRKNDRSRGLLQSGTVATDAGEYSLNEPFKQETIKVADTLDLDEIEAVKLLLLAQDEVQELDRPLVTAAVLRFHRKRLYLLECLRLILKQSQDPDANEQFANDFGGYVRTVLGIQDNRVANGYAYWQKCLAAMGDIERWLQQVADRMAAQTIVNNSGDDDTELYELQRITLTHQHESLAAICTHLIKAGYSSIDNFRGLLSTARRLDRHDIVMVHYIPVITSSINQLVSSERSSSLEDARALHQTIVSGANEGPGLRYFHAAIMIWWLAEYSGRYIDYQPGTTNPAGVNLEEEAEARSRLFMEALKDNAFHFMLSVSRDVKPIKWYDPAKARLNSFLTDEAPTLPEGTISPSAFFQDLFSEQMQSFVDAFITNMPDTLRRLKTEEDDQRRLLHSRFQRGGSEQDLHLERFLVIISYAFADSPDAASSFWQDTDGNLYGFLQWAAKRQTTPRVAAFCEMLRSLAEDEICATAAHRFLLEEGATAAGRVRRSSSLSYSHILSELEYYATSLKDKGVQNQATGFHPSHQTGEDQIVEAETDMMLECHLGLVAHLCRESEEARVWYLTQSWFPAQDLLKLCTLTVHGRIRACAFSALSAVLAGSDTATAQTIWEALERWIQEGALPVDRPSGGPPKRGPAVTSPDKEPFKTMGEGFEDSNAFVALLTALVSSYDRDAVLHDVLPFPEGLGSAHRNPGIEPYIDFVFGTVFSQLSTALSGDKLQQRILRWQCLNFTSICLRMFNEDLVAFANQTPISLDSAIHTSSMASYVRLHPFARVMEWLFNDKVLSALFATARQDAAEVSASDSDSALLMSLTKAIEVIDLVMSRQSTYLSLVRTTVKSQSLIDRKIVANAALASFEDAILNHLQIIVDVGLYCGTGHEDLTLISLKLLEKFSASRKLVVSPTAGFGRQSDRSKIIGIMEKDDDAERVSRSLISKMQFDEREFEASPSSPGYAIKTNILDFLNTCLEAVPNRPTVAHLLLGFSCGASTIDIPSGGLFESGGSLFHAVLRLSIEYPARNVDGTYVPWSSTLKQKCTDILTKLWRSPISSGFVMAELRDSDYFTTEAVQQRIADAETPWAGLVISDPDFIFSDGAIAFDNFLRGRTAFYEYVAMELRLAHESGMATLKARIESSLLGVTVLPDGQKEPTPSIFELFDFMELQINDDPSISPHFRFFDKADFDLCRKQDSDAEYDLANVSQVIALASNQLRVSGRLPSSAEEEALLEEAEKVTIFLRGQNHKVDVSAALVQALKAWVQIMTVMLRTCQFDATTKVSFILQALQIILPKLEMAYTADRVTAIQLADLARTLLANIDFTAAPLADTQVGDMTNDTMSSLFRAGLNGIISSVSNAQLNEICYQICYRYLRGVALKTLEPARTDNGATNGALNRSLVLAPRSTPSSPLRAQHLRTIKSLGSRLINTVCDDTSTGQSTCRISALLFLNALVNLADKEDSRYVIDAFTQYHYVDLLVDSIKTIPSELDTANATESSALISFYDAILSLLLRISQTKVGAALVQNSGIFAAIRESRVFSTDPDIGLDIDSPDSLKVFYNLMLSLLRVVNAVVITRGPQNETTKALARQFVAENRSSVVGVFKRHARVGGREKDGLDLEELVDNLTVLISASSFMEYEEAPRERGPRMMFS